MPDERLDYAGPDTRSATRRTAGQWAILLTVWPIGLIIWAAYVALIVLLIIRIL
jgi:hypothetical protein